MRVGIHTGERDTDKLIAYCRELGVDEVCLRCGAIDGYEQSGVPDEAHLKAVQSQMQAAGKKVSVMIPKPLQFDVLAEPKEWQPEVDSVLQTLEVLGRCEVEAVLLFNFMKAAPEAQREEQWRRVGEIYCRLTEQAEKTGVKIATHGHCLPEYLVWNWESLWRLLHTTVSPFNGWTYDPGILVLVEGDPYGTIEKVKGRIPFMHARDVVGDWRSWDEVFLGRGKVDFPRVLQLLKEAGFDGLICPEHLGHDWRGGENREAMAVRFLKEEIAKVT